jgi:hypothetical protein
MPRWYAACIVAALMPACGASSRAPCAHALTQAAVAPASAGSTGAPAPTRHVPAGDVYLPEDRAGGSPFCFDPSSAALRDYVKHPRRDETTPLESEALADDVRDLHTAMKKLYAGYPELLQSTHFDVERFFLAWEKRLRAAGPTVTLADGVLRPLVALRQRIRDNHLMIAGGGSRLSRRADLAFSEYQARGVVEGFDAASCTFDGVTPVTGTARVAKLLTKRGLDAVTTFSARSTVPGVEVRCGDRTTRFERRISHARPSDDGAPAYEYRVVGDASLVIVRTLSGSSEVKALLARIPKDYDEHRKRPVIVFDFRGNGGGSDQPVYDWIAKAKPGPWADPYVQIAVTGAARACGEWNDLVLNQIFFDRVDTPEARAERDAFLAATPLGDVRGAPAQVLSGPPEPSHAASPYQGRIFAIIDDASSSSGETAPDALRAALGATVQPFQGACGVGPSAPCLTV